MGQYVLPRGNTGPKGDDGPMGPSSSVFPYKADTQGTNISDPGSGKMRWNNAEQRLATMLIFDRLTSDGFDATLLLTVSDIHDRFIVQDADFALNYQVWEKTGPGEMSADFFVVPVVFLEGGGSDFKNQHPLMVLIKTAIMPAVRNTAPLDGQLQPNEQVLWLDMSRKPPKLMYKAKRADGTIEAGPVK